jgi:Transposase DDE domain
MGIFSAFCQESRREIFPIPEGIQVVIHCRPGLLQGTVMGSDNAFHIGFFGDARRQRAGAALFERVVETGSVVVREVGGDRAGEMAAHRFLDSPHVTHEEILATAGQRTASACAGRRIVAAQLIVLGDREFDIYAQFVRVPPRVELIVRASQNRSLAGDDEQLFSAPRDWRVFGTMAVRVPPHRPGETERIAKVSVKAGRVRIARPLHGDRADAPSVMLTLVEVHEIDPPKGHKPIVWRLLTTLPVCGEPDEFAAANEIVQLYRLRWRIEQVFRAMKSDGLQLEETQVHEASRLFKLTAIVLTAAARTIQLVDARDGSQRPASDVADDDLLLAAEVIGPTLEGKTPRQQNPHPKRSLAWLSWIAARLGGWNCYYKPPGPKTMRAGWTKLADRACGYLLARATQNV